uniref:Phosphodiesterase n=1 Tax=Scophthalmus maximus TaxID=52904 RepID=A0A8D3DKL8_SCOMX
MTALERKEGKDLRGQQVFLRPEESSAPALTTRQSTTVSEQLQDALLRLAAVVDARSLRVALRDSIQELLSSTECVCVYMLEGHSRLLSDDPPHELPLEGKIRCVIADQLRRCQCAGLPPSELPEKHRICLAAPLAAHRRGVCLFVSSFFFPTSASPSLFSGQHFYSCRHLQSRHPSIPCLVFIISPSVSWFTFTPPRPRCLNASLRGLLSVHSRTCSAFPSLLNGNLPLLLSGYHSHHSLSLFPLLGELYDLDAASLQLKVINYLQQQTQSQCCCLLLVSEDNHQLFYIHLSISIYLPTCLSACLSNLVLLYVFFPSSCQEERRQLSSMLGCEISSMLCVPVVSRATAQVVALACAFNKQGGLRHTEADEYAIQHCFCYTSTVLTSTLAFQKEQKLKVECQALLQVAKNLFTHLDDVSVLLQEIIVEARNLSDAEICSVFLLDRVSHELVAKVFDGGVVSDEENEFRIPADQGIAGHVATTGQILNIKDAYSHPLFYRGVDDSTGFKTRNILCFPIKDENNEVIGVAELVNKMNGPWFNRFDEDLATAFSIYCGISIAHSLLYKRVHEAQFRSHLANEMMMYHMKVSEEEVTKMLVTGIEPVKEIHPCFAEFTYTPRSLLDDTTPMCVLSMLEDMGFINTYKIDRHTLARFCLMVKRGYRDPPYHNWMHAFSVSHFCYLLYKNLGLSNYLEDIEILALFVSCMCHDLDHRGTNNSFQVASVRAQMMFRHHFAQAIAILNTHGCNIFEKFSRKDYQRMLDLMRDIILATDLAHHLRIFKDLQKMADDGYNPKRRSHRSMLLCLLMTSCDLSDQTKGWKTTRKIAELIYKEFFSQGDLEKAMGNRPSEMMDREKAYIPELQISFMEHIAMPIYKLLSELIPGATELYERVAANREQWTKVSHKFSIRGLPSNNSLDFLDQEYELLQSQGAFGSDDHCLNGCLEDAEGGKGQ